MTPSNHSHAEDHANNRRAIQSAEDRRFGRGEPGYEGDPKDDAAARRRATYNAGHKAGVEAAIAYHSDPAMPLPFGPATEEPSILENRGWDAGWKVGDKRAKVTA